MTKQNQKLQSGFCGCLKMKNFGIIPFFHTAIQLLTKNLANKMLYMMFHLVLKCVSDTTILSAHVISVFKVFPRCLL